MGEKKKDFEMVIGGLLYIGNDENSRDIIITGGYDKTIKTWDLNTTDEIITKPLTVVMGHTGEITCLARFSNGDIVSGSFDTTAKVWAYPNYQAAYTLKEHTATIWDVLVNEFGTIFTCSGDKTIKIWNGNQCIKTLEAHKQSVRCLCKFPEIGFLSSASDGTICHWTYEGNLLSTYHSNEEEYIYSLTILPSSNGEFASVSEDKTLKIWRGGECIQTILHPYENWYTAAFPNGDIAVAGKDGVIRIWTRDISREAPQDVLSVFMEDFKVAESKAPAKQTIGDLSLDQLESPDSLSIPGRPGDTKMINMDGKATLYNWDESKNSWEYGGEIVDAIDGEKNKKVR